MRAKSFSLILGILAIILINGCLFTAPEVPDIVEPTATRVAAIFAKPPTATNFPRIGTATPAPPTATPTATSLPPPTGQPLFDDETLERLMVGTIRSVGVDASLKIVDNRATGGERIAEVVIVSKHNIASSNLLLKLFVLEVGNAVRSIRIFTESDLDAKLDRISLRVVDQEDQLLGTISSPLSLINDYLDGRTTVNEALSALKPTGVFESFLE